MNKLGFEFLRLPVKKGSPDDIALDLLDHILTKHPEVDLVQLQINYLDWDSASIQSRLCYETARKHHKKIIVMEPIKGGALASPPAEAVRLLRDLSPEESMASFALRFAESLPEVEIVLSGMNTMAQLLDNLKERKPLIPEEQARLMQAAPRNFLSQTIFAGSANISITDQISLFH